jgi:hypothetical protein
VTEDARIMLQVAIRLTSSNLDRGTRDGDDLAARVIYDATDPQWNSKRCSGCRTSC